jgi:hypothetical protein
MMAETQEELELQKVMVVSPFERRPRCAKCGHRVTWLDRLRAGVVSAFNYTYCEGSLDSTVNIRTPFGGRAELSTTCFGVFEEHLHLTCHRCGHHTLMATVKGKSCQTRAR